MKAGAKKRNPKSGPGSVITIEKKNASFQIWESLRHNRKQRHREGRFLVEGVKPLGLLKSNGWQIQSLLAKKSMLSPWAQQFFDTSNAYEKYWLSSELMNLLSGKEESSELIAVVQSKDLKPQSLEAKAGTYVILDRPNSPGNLGTLIRTADAFGARAVLIYGHSADFFDPKTIAASVGAVFSVPIAQLSAQADFEGLIEKLKAESPDLKVITLDEKAEATLSDYKPSSCSVVVVGNETDGLSKLFRDSSDQTLRIPMAGAVSSLNAAVSGSICLYEFLSRSGSLNNQ